MKKEVQKPSALMTKIEVLKIQAEEFVSDSGRASSEYGLIQGVQQNRFRPLSEL